MYTSITKVGNSQGLIFDHALCKLTGLKAGDEVDIAVNDGGAITITRRRHYGGSEIMDHAICQTIEDYAKSRRKLA